MKRAGYREGTPTLIEWEGRWRYSESDPPSTFEECNQATFSLWSYLEKTYRVGSGDWDDLFLRGDYFGDRTQTLEIVYPPALDPGLSKLLLGWVGDNAQKWRIALPSFLGHRDAFVVYPDGLRYAGDLGIPSEPVCREKAIAMLALPIFAHALERAREEGWPVEATEKHSK